MSLNHLLTKDDPLIIENLKTSDNATVEIKGEEIQIGETCFPTNQGTVGQILTLGTESNCGVWEDPVEQLPKTNIAGKYLRSTFQSGQPEWVDVNLDATQNITATPNITNISGETNTEQLTFKAQDNEIINLSTLPNKGTAGYFLTSDGNSPPNLYWSPDGAGVSGITQTQVPPPTTAQDKVMIYNSNDGLTCKSSNIQYIDGLGFNMNNLQIANSSSVNTNAINAVNPVTEISVGSNLNMQTNEIQSDVTVNLNAGSSIDCKVNGSKLEVTDTAINAKTTLKASNIQEYVGGAGVNVDGVKIQDARLINSSSSQDFLRLDAGGVNLNSTNNMDLNAETEMNLRLGGDRKLQILDTETIINNNLKTNTIVENTLDNGVNVDGLQIKDARITNLIDGASNLRLDSNGVLLNSGGNMDFDANGVGYEMNLRLNGDRKINIQTNETSINNDLKVDNIVKNTIDYVNIEGSTFKTGSIVTVNQLTTLDSIDVNDNIIQNVSDGINPTDAVNLGQLNGKLDLSGGTMSGDLIMNLNKVKSNAEVLDNNDYTTKLYVDGQDNGLQTNIDGKVSKTGDTMTGNLLMGSNKIQSTAEVLDNNDYTTKTYVDGKDSLKLDVSEKSDPNGVCPLVNNLIPNQYLPDLAITQVYVVENNASRDNIASVQAGDVAVVTEDPTTGANNYIWNGPESTAPLNSIYWVKLVVPQGTVTSVNTQSGAVTLDTDDIPETVSNPYFTPAREADLINRQGTVTMLQNLNMGLKNIDNMSDPTVGSQASTKDYVDFINTTRLKVDGSNAMTGNINMNANNINMNNGSISNATTLQTQFINEKNALQGISFQAKINMGNNKIEGLQSNPTNPNDVANKDYVDTQSGLKVSKSGDTMTGTLDMVNNRVQTSFNPIDIKDLCNKQYVDNNDNLKLNLTGGNMTGDIIMFLNKVKSNAVVTDNDDYATKLYVDNQDFTKLSRSGGIMLGDITMSNGQNINNANIVQCAILKETTNLNGIAFDSAFIDMQNVQINNLANGTLATDAINKGQADTDYLQVNGGNVMTANLDLGSNDIINCVNISNSTALNLNSTLNDVICNATQNVVTNSTEFVVQNNNILAPSYIRGRDGKPLVVYGKNNNLQLYSSGLGNTLVQSDNGEVLITTSSIKKIFLQSSIVELDGLAGNSVITSISGKNLEVKSNNANAYLSAFGATFDAYVTSQRDIYIAPANNAVINAGNNISTNTADHYFGNGGASTNIYVHNGTTNVLQDTQKNCFAQRSKNLISQTFNGPTPAGGLDVIVNSGIVRNMGLTGGGDMSVIIQYQGYYKISGDFELKLANNTSAVFISLYTGPQGGPYTLIQPAERATGTSQQNEAPHLSFNHYDDVIRPVGHEYRIRVSLASGSVTMYNSSFNVERLMDSN